MKNNFHEAYNTNYNFPLHISSPDSVQAFLDGHVKLLTMLPSQWPKLRGRNITRKEYDVVDTYSFTTANGKEHVVQNVIFTQLEHPVHGKIVDDKYVFSSDCLGMSMPLELIFEDFAMIGCRPVVRREWSHEYMSPYPFYYSLVTIDEVKVANRGEHYFEIEGYAELGFNCLADILTHSFQYQWSHAKATFIPITDPHEVTMRIRKPWMQNLVQSIYGERDMVNSDISKLVHFLFKKCEGMMTEEEKEAAKHILERDVSLEQLSRVSDKELWLNKLIAAYKSEQLLVPGSNVFEDPLFGFIAQQVVKGN